MASEALWSRPGRCAPPPSSGPAGAGGRRHCPRPALPHRQARTVAAQTSRGGREGGREGGWRRVKAAVNVRHTPGSQEALGVTP